MQRLTPYLVVGMLGLVGLASGCWHSPIGAVRRALVVGDYVYHSDDPRSSHDADRLALRADGTYVLAHMPGGRPGPREEGVWRLVDQVGRPYVVLDHAGHRIEVRGKRVRLMIDYDLSIWYEKVR